MLPGSLSGSRVPSRSSGLRTRRVGGLGRRTAADRSACGPRPPRLPVPWSACCAAASTPQHHQVVTTLRICSSSLQRSSLVTLLLRFTCNGPHAGSRTSPASSSEPLLHATVARDGGQYTTPPHLGCVEDHPAVRREARRFVDARRRSAPAPAASRSPAPRR